MDKRSEINASRLMAALGESFSIISLAVDLGGLGCRNWGEKCTGWWGCCVLKLKLHKIAPYTQGIRRHDVMISGEVQSLALPRRS